MKIIVITGKSGSGKSFIAKMLGEILHSRVLSLDEISHMSLKNEEIKSEILKIFGKQVFNKNIINRKKLGKIVFENPQKLDILNNLSWKFIDEFIDKEIEKLNDEYLILEYALLPKMKYFKTASFKILVEANKITRIERLSARDNLSTKYLLARENNSLEYNKKDYDFIINNTSLSKQQLFAETEKIAKKIQI